MGEREPEPGTPGFPTAIGPDGPHDGTLLASNPELSTLTRVALPDEPGPPLAASAGGRALAMPPGLLHEGLLGRGAMGEVHRVRDPALNRFMALKVLQGANADRRASLQRFLEEAQITAQLQHPGIVPVHQIGTLPDGRLYFLMQEVRGRTLAVVIHELHRASTVEGWGTGASGLTFRRLIDVFRVVCEAVAYAHQRGVIHRDLKPDNLMVGSHGEVQVMDWGIAKVLGTLHGSAPGREDGPVQSVVTTPRDQSTRAGAVFGTPCYMAPEQARGQTDALDARTDVYALGAILFTILYGARPYRRFPSDVAIARVAGGSPPEVPTGARPPVPDELERICARAMAFDPEERFPDAAALASAVLDWLDGAARRERALALVREASISVPEVRRLRAESERVRGAARFALERVPPWAPEADKRSAWRDLDSADALEARAELLEIEIEQLLQGALGHDPDCLEARSLLADRWYRAHEQADRDRDRVASRRAEALWRAQVRALPARSPARRRHERLLRGEGQLSLHLQPHGVRVALARYELRGRRLQPGPRRDLGRTPVEPQNLPHGSYLLYIDAPGGEVRVPVAIPRAGTVFVAADEGGERPLVLPAAGELGPDDVFVAAGLSRLGGDPAAIGGLPARSVWLPSFIMQRFPVTNHQYCDFLDDLVRRGLTEQALQHVPREKAGTVGQLGAILYGRRADGTFFTRADADGDLWLPQWPVFNVSWEGAVAYARWRAERDGLDWRLPTSDEWERAARGADGRFYPWGDQLDPSWCCMRDSHPGGARPSVVDGFPVDESPFGVRGLAGNARDWCSDALSEDRRVNRGGNWLGNAREARLADQHDHVIGHRAAEIGFRLARSVAGAPP